jgi:hypothetical protein
MAPAGRNNSERTANIMAVAEDVEALSGRSALVDPDLLR